MSLPPHPAGEKEDDRAERCQQSVLTFQREADGVYYRLEAGDFLTKKKKKKEKAQPRGQV